MKNALIGLIKNYEPSAITPNSITYEIEMYGKLEKVVINWTVADPNEWNFELIEPRRTVEPTVCVLGTYSLNSDNLNSKYRTCYSVTIDGLTYKIPLTLEESNYFDLSITQLFIGYQNNKLSTFKDIIGNSNIETNETGE